MTAQKTVAPTPAPVMRSLADTQAAIIDPNAQFLKLREIIGQTILLKGKTLVEDNVMTGKTSYDIHFEWKNQPYVAHAGGYILHQQLHALTAEDFPVFVTIQEKQNPDGRQSSLYFS
jgi:hypothetical protein